MRHYTSYAAGDDGARKEGRAWPNPRFMVGTGAEADCVRDALTGLMWSKHANLPNSTKTWQQAMDYVTAMNSGGGLCGYTDWRLPDIKELNTLVNVGQSNPDTWLGGQGFTNVQLVYWSSTTYSGTEGRALYISMYYGDVYVNFKTNDLYLWPVRDGQSSLEHKFTDNGNGTVTDNSTGLIWLKDSNCFGSKMRTDALSAANSLSNGQCSLIDGSQAGDWRLPNRNELFSLIDFSHYSPALTSDHLFANVQSNGSWSSNNGYWSSSAFSPNTGIAWYVNMYDGSVSGDFSRINGVYVWPVRGGQSGSFSNLGILVNWDATITNNANVNLRLSATDDSGSVTQMKFSTDNVNWSEPESYSVSRSYTLPSGEGNKTIHVKFGDAAGQWSTAYSDTITLDTTAPAINSATSSANNGTYKAGGTINITLNFSEAISSTGLTINLNSGGSLTTGALSNVSSFSGTYTVGSGQTASDLSISSVTGTITDAANNSTTNPAIPSGQNIGDSKEIVLDTTAPVVSAGANQTKNTQFTQTATATDIDNMTYQWTKQGGPGTITFGTPTALSTTISASSEGTYTLRFTATDAAGNSAYGDTTLVWDSTPPVGSSYFYFLPKTGQTTSYGARDDGALQMGLDYTDQIFTDNGLTVTDKLYGMTWMKNAWSSVYPLGVGVSIPQGVTTPNPRFTDNGDGTITDNLTRIIWLKNVNCVGIQEWISALSSANSLANGQCGLSDGSRAGDWRLPNIIELVSLPINHTSTPVPWLNGQGFLNVQPDSAYWSSSTHTVYKANAWGFSMTTGSIYHNPKADSFYVWPVRGEPAGFGNFGISINRGVETAKITSVFLSFSATDVSGVTEMMLSNDGVFDTETAEAYSISKSWTLSSGDGAKTVYVKFKDAAGNWSTAYSDTITLDTTVPATTASPAGGTYTATQTVALSCSDGPGSGCKVIYYTTDGTAPATSSSVYSSPLSIPSNTTLKFFSVDNAGNAEAVKTESYVDNVKPTVVISSPADGKIDYRLYAISGTAADAGSGLSKVELQITDGTYFVDSDFSFSTTPLWINITGTEAWTFNSSSIKWEDNTTYTISARSTDVAGNVSDIASATFTKVPNYAFFTTLSLDLSTQTMLQEDILTAAGKLTRYPDIGSGLKGQTIIIAITAPDGSSSTQTTTTYDSLGHYKLEDIAGFSQKGVYTIEALFDGTSLLTESNSDAKSVFVGSSAGYAIIVEGKIAADSEGEHEGLDSHNKTANRIYNSLIERGFTDENIYYFNYETDQAGVDAVPSEAAIKEAIEGTGPFSLKDKLNGSAAPLYVIMVDHGDPDAFYIDDETITPGDLNKWLSTLESGLDDVAKLEKRIIIIGSCYSGSFIPLLSAPGRVIITSAAANEESYKGPNEPDNIRSGEFFLEEFFKGLVKGDSLKSAFEGAADKTGIYTKKDNEAVNSSYAGNKNAMQHPLLDDDGNGKGSNIVSDDDGDGMIARNLFMGAGVSYSANSNNNPADLTGVTETVFLDSAETAASLWATANYDNEVSSAWLEIRKPSKRLSAKGGSTQLEVDIPKELMQLGPGKWSPINSITFDESGKYEMFYFVRDKESGEISPMKRSVVYKNKTGNIAPGAFSLVSPSNESEQKTVLALQWKETADPEGDNITYTVLISKDSTFATVDYMKEEIHGNMTIVGPEARLADQATYYWKVLAIDTYGAKTGSPVRSFTTNNTNGLPGIISGSVINVATGAGVGSATVTSSAGGTATSLPDGTYFISVQAGAATLTVTADNYKPKSIDLNVLPGAASVRNIKLEPATAGSSGIATLTVMKSGAGTGTLQSLTKGKADGKVACGADCTETEYLYNKNVTVTLKAVPAEGSYFAKWTSGCTGANPVCTIKMTGEKTVNAQFNLKPTLSVEKSGTGSGTVRSSSAGINCGDACEVVFSAMQKVVLTAKPDAGSTFDGWSGGGCTGKAKCIVTMSSSQTVTASFGQPDISPSETSHDFGSQYIKAKAGKQDTITITNNGTGLLKVTKSVISGPDKRFFKVINPAAFVVKPNEQRELKVTFKPTTTGVKNSTLTITSNDPDSPAVTITLTGTGTSEKPSVGTALTEAVEMNMYTGALNWK